MQAGRIKRGDGVGKFVEESRRHGFEAGVFVSGYAPRAFEEDYGSSGGLERGAEVGREREHGRIRK